MRLSDAQAFGQRLAGHLGLQLININVVTRAGARIPSEELRKNDAQRDNAVQLEGCLSPLSDPFNIADFRAQLAAAADADDPTGTLVSILHGVFPSMRNIESMFTRIPAVQAVLQNGMVHAASAN